ncbi:alkene reductase [Cellulomonas sp. SLBN-39]|uniref:alkene reductase n=1 Tax=Cellulomonas sp. SLBN-39 TaxID=2768446 RepID=UPI00115003A9|nr:alkene reductase [Cellulomonas sp. SLBN-39]TQL04156.1 2,4-dienoyl-CoA reductase-like NADH-dependent reductase (Old Yellow Enzyme family) [Cellulomonas sp. SLBN-39]
MDLFSPVQLGELTLPNRVVMAPLTRKRSGDAGIPGDIVVDYYAQRAGTGLIVTEGTFTSHEGRAFDGQPGIVTDDQVTAWRRVTDAVHARGGLIAMQIMHGGRVSHPDITGTDRIVAPSAVAIDATVHTRHGKQPCPVPHALTTDELPAVRDEIVTAATRALEAGMDAVELHAANGYLLHEFLSPTTNQRTDAYGGTPQARTRFVTEVVTAVADAVGPGRVGLRISPAHNIQGALETDPHDVATTYGTLVDALAPLPLAYLSILHADPAGPLTQDLRHRFAGPVVVNSGFTTATTRDEALALVAHAHGDAVAVGRPLIANPDLVDRWRTQAPENTPDPTTFYTDGPHGYTDYPALAG